VIVVIGYDVYHDGYCGVVYGAGGHSSCVTRECQCCVATQSAPHLLH